MTKENKINRDTQMMTFGGVEYKKEPETPASASEVIIAQQRAKIEQLERKNALLEQGMAELDEELQKAKSELKRSANSIADNARVRGEEIVALQAENAIQKEQLRLMEEKFERMRQTVKELKALRG